MRPCLTKQKQRKKTIIKIITHPVTLDSGSPRSLTENGTSLLWFLIQKTARKTSTAVGTVPAPSNSTRLSLALVRSSEAQSEKAASKRRALTSHSSLVWSHSRYQMNHPAHFHVWDVDDH